MELVEVLDNFQAKEKIADAAIAWRESFRTGRFDEMGERFESLCLIVDDYLDGLDG